MTDIRNETPKYLKKKPQVSNAARRSDHKHKYIRSIAYDINKYNNSLRSAFWTLNCEVCGRYKGLAYGSYFTQHDPELYRIADDGGEIPLTVPELAEKYPGTPIYTNEGKYLFPETRVV